MTLLEGDVEAAVLLEGFPGRSCAHGLLGWSTVGLVRSGGRVVVVDTGAFGARGPLRDALAARGLAPADVTDLVLTHAHFDHLASWVLFPGAAVHVSSAELDAALAARPDDELVPRLEVAALAGHPRLHLVEGGEEVAPGVEVTGLPGHTPGHLGVVARGAHHDVLFAGDAAKHRAELLERRQLDTADAPMSTETLHRIWAWWRARPGNVVVPGHATPLVVAGDGCAHRAPPRPARMRTWLDGSLAANELDLRTDGGI